jgi:hypothetical protein
MRLLVKEHPVALQNRSRAYYEALLRVPNVALLDPRCPSRDAVQHAALLITIAGSMGQEAAILGRPVVLLGHAPYELLPPTMVRRAAPSELPEVIGSLLREAAPDEQALVDYVAAVMSCSVRANLYSDLLGRGGSTGTAVAGGGQTDSMIALARHTTFSILQARRGIASAGRPVDCHAS